MKQYIVKDAKRFDNSGATIQFSFTGEYIQVTEGSDTLLFFQGWEASGMLEEARRIFEEEGDVYLKDCVKHLVLPYLENL